MTRALLVASLLLAGPADWGAPCKETKDCPSGFVCEEHHGKKLCTKSCRQNHAEDDCPAKWVCRPEPYDPRDGLCTPTW